MRLKAVVRSSSMPRFLLLLLMLSTCAASGGRALAHTSETELKAAFVFALTRYVDWPPERLPDGANLRVCLARDTDPLASAMQPLAGRQVRGHPFELFVGVTGAVLRTCHVLVNPPPAGRWGGVPGLLIISDVASAGEDVAHVRFYMDDNRVRFDVDLAAARQAGLQLSSQLLRLARKVNQ